MGTTRFINPRWSKDWDVEEGFKLSESATFTHEGISLSAHPVAGRIERKDGAWHPFVAGTNGWESAGVPTQRRCQAKNRVLAELSARRSA